MNKTNNMRHGKKDLRWQLLVTVSAAALLASAYGAGEAEAADNDSDRPLLWIELGGQLERLSDAQQPSSPPFMASITQANLLSALNVQRPPAYAIDEEGKISFEPDGSDWVVSANVRYGRANAKRHHHQQTKNAALPIHFTYGSHHNYHNFGTYYPTLHQKFADGQSQQNERHVIIDFMAGKDVGLGAFGLKGTSVVSGGVRIAQLNSQSDVTLRALPDLQYPAAITNFAALFLPVADFHAFYANEEAKRSFHGIGPELSWDASMSVAGNPDSGELSIDWGINGGVLFGRQKAQGRHQTNTQAYRMYFAQSGYEVWVNGKGAPIPNVKRGHFDNWTAAKAKCGFAGYPSYCNFNRGFYYYTGHATKSTANSGDFNRSRRVAVPDFGAFAGVSYRYSNAKLSFGYRADFFFGAMDGGIDARKSENRAFYGPFASISIGLGD